jgi:hypothetical protein
MLFPADVFSSRLTAVYLRIIYQTTSPFLLPFRKRAFWQSSGLPSFPSNDSFPSRSRSNAIDGSLLGSPVDVTSSEDDAISSRALTAGMLLFMLDRPSSASIVLLSGLRLLSSSRLVRSDADLSVVSSDLLVISSQRPFLLSPTGPCSLIPTFSAYILSSTEGLTSLTSSYIVSVCVAIGSTPSISSGNPIFLPISHPLTRFYLCRFDLEIPATILPSL